MASQATDHDRRHAECEERLRELADRVRKRSRELAVLAEVAARIHGQEDVAGILETALQAILSGLGLQTAWVLLEDERDGRLHLAAHRGVSGTYLKTVSEHGLGECLCREVFASGKGVQARNTTQCPRMPTIVDDLEQPVAHACVPLAFDGTSRGGLNVAARPEEQFSEEELSFLVTVGRQVCLAVEGARHLKAERLYNHEARALAAL